MESRKPDAQNSLYQSALCDSNVRWTDLPVTTAEQVIRDSLGRECLTNGNLTEALAEVIRRRRLDLGISQQTLAVVTGLDRGYLISIEHAKRNPSITTLYQIAAGLRIRASELMSLAEQQINGGN
jgi:DNA-binding XRE family transcriptional regulator